MSDFLRLNTGDWVRGLVVAVFSAVVTYVATIVNVPGFDFVDLNWQEFVKIAIAAGVAYLSKNLLTTSDGKVAGIV